MQIIYRHAKPTFHKVSRRGIEKKFTCGSSRRAPPLHATLRAASALGVEYENPGDGIEDLYSSLRSLHSPLRPLRLNLFFNRKGHNGKEHHLHPFTVHQSTWLSSMTAPSCSMKAIRKPGIGDMGASKIVLPATATSRSST